MTFGVALWPLVSRSWAASSTSYTVMFVFDIVLCIIWFVAFIVEATTAAANRNRIFVAFLVASAVMGAFQL